MDGHIEDGILWEKRPEPELFVPDGKKATEKDFESLKKDDLNEVLQSICDDLDVYIDWHKHLSESEGYDKESQLIRVRCYEIAKKHVKCRIRKEENVIKGNV